MEIAALYRRHRAQIQAMCLGMVGNRQEAMELCQDAFLLAMRKWGSFESRSERLTWIFAIARNACLNHLRRRVCHARRMESFRREEAGSSLSLRGDPEAQLVSGILFDQTLARVGHSTRRVLIRYYKDGLNRSEIAVELGVTPSAVSKLLIQMESAWRLGRMSRYRPRKTKIPITGLDKPSEGGSLRGEKGNRMNKVRYESANGR